jgi:hypothetical protein
VRGAPGGLAETRTIRYARAMTPPLPVRLVTVLAAFIAVVSSASLARADKGDVERAMAEMEKAVLAGDGPGYLKHVIPAEGAIGDGVFRKEQENWAADLKLHAPEAFHLAIEESSAGHEPHFWPDRAEFELSMSWRMPAGGNGDGPGGAGGQDRKVSYPVSFVRSAEGEWLYAGEVWVKFDGEMIPPDSAAPGAKPYLDAVAKSVEGLEDVAKRVIEVMPEVRAHVEEGFELKVRHTQEVKVYQSMRHLQASIYLSYADPLGGWNEPGESIKLLARPTTAKEHLRQVLSHEFGHVATFEMGPHANDIPWWAIEGVAEVSAEKYAGGDEACKRFVEGKAKAGALAPWDEMADFRKTPDKWMVYVYKQGEHMVGFVSEKYGRSGRNKWFREMAQGAPIDEATHRALGISFEELDKLWRASIDAATVPSPDKNDDAGKR